MGKLIICPWMWGKKYGSAHFAKLLAGLRRGVSQPHKVWLSAEWDCLGPGFPADDFVSGPIWDEHLTKVQGCFARLRMFDPKWQAMVGAEPGDRLVSVDLDAIVTGSLDPLFNRPDNFTILTGANAANPCPYNGSLFMLRAGHRPDVWTDFSLDAAAKVPFYEFPDDQAWFAHKLPGVVGWKVGASSGVYAFQKPGWPKGEALPADARLVVFPGWRDPSKFTHVPWVREKWVA